MKKARKIVQTLRDIESGKIQPPPGFYAEVRYCMLDLMDKLKSSRDYSIKEALKECENLSDNEVAALNSFVDTVLIKI